MEIIFEVELAEVEYPDASSDCSQIIDTIWIKRFSKLADARKVFESFRNNVPPGKSVFLYAWEDEECEELDEIKGDKKQKMKYYIVKTTSKAKDNNPVFKEEERVYYNGKEGQPIVNRYSVSLFGWKRKHFAEKYIENWKEWDKRDKYWNHYYEIIEINEGEWIND